MDNKSGINWDKAPSGIDWNKVPSGIDWNAVSNKNDSNSASQELPKSVKSSVRRNLMYNLGAGVVESFLEPLRLVGEGISTVATKDAPIHKLLPRLTAYMDSEKRLNEEAANGDILPQAAHLVGNILSPVSKNPIKLAHTAIDSAVGAHALLKLLAKGAATGAIAGTTTYTPNVDSYTKLQDSSEFGALVSLLGSGLGKFGTGVGRLAATFTGGGAGIREAYKAGLKGGTANSDYWSAYKGQIKPEDVVKELQKGSAALDKARSSYYSALEPKITDQPYKIRPSDSEVIDASILDAMRTSMKFGYSSSPEVSKVKGDVQDILNEYAYKLTKNLIPRTVGSLNLPRTQLNTLADSLKTGGALEAQKRVPAVISSAMNDVMKRRLPGWGDLQTYNAAQEDLLTSIEKSLGVTSTEIPNMEAAINKLYKTPNNEFKAELIDELEKYGPTNIKDKVAGFRTKKWTPEGLGKATQVMAVMGSVLHPGTLGLAALQAPALVGPTANFLGSSNRQLNKLTASIDRPTLISEIINRIVLDKRYRDN